jgi:hypothetical protein
MTTTTAHAVAALAERGISSPSIELIRLEMAIQHLEEACCLFQVLDQYELELLTNGLMGKAMAQRQLVERYSMIAGVGRS